MEHLDRKNVDLEILDFSIKYHHERKIYHFYCELICKALLFQPRQAAGRFLDVVAPLRAASEAPSPVGAAAADGSAAQ